MARQEFPIGAGVYFTFGSPTRRGLRWVFSDGETLIDSGFFADPNEPASDRDIARLQFTDENTSNIIFRLGVDNLVDSGDLSVSAETSSRLITLTAGAFEVTFVGPDNSEASNSTPVEPYQWGDSNFTQSQLTTLVNEYNALSQADKDATVLILDDGVVVDVDVTPSTLTGVVGTISATVEIQEAPLDLSAWTQPDNTDLVFAGLWEAGGSGINIYRSPANGGTARGSFLEGTRELLAGQNVERIRSITAGLRLNDQPSAEDILAFFDAGGDGEGGTFYLVTEDGEYTSVTPSIGGGGNANNIVFTVSGDFQTALAGISDGDRFILAYTTPVDVNIDVTPSTLTGVVGTISAAVEVESPPPGNIDVTPSTLTGVVGTISATVEIQEAPPGNIEVTPSMLTGVVGTISATVEVQVFTITSDNLPLPESFILAGRSSSTLFYTWSEPSLPSGARNYRYEGQMKLSSASNYTDPVIEIADTEYQAENLQNGEEYDFRIRAKAEDADGNTVTTSWIELLRSSTWVSSQNLTNIPSEKGVSIKGWIPAARSLVYEENKLFEVREGETLTLELYYFMTIQFGNDYGSFRLKYTLVDATTATTQLVTVLLPVDQDTAETWHFWTRKEKIVRPAGWTNQAAYVKDFTLEYTGKPPASTAIDGYLVFSAFQVTRAAQSIYIGDGQIVAPHIAAGAIVADKIAAGAITAAKIAAGTITADRIMAGVIPDLSNLDIPESFDDLSGFIDSPDIATGAIIADKIAANAIIASKIAAGAITASKIQAGVIPDNFSDLAGQIGSADIVAGSIITDKLAANSVTQLKRTPISSSSGSVTLSPNLRSQSSTISISHLTTPLVTLTYSPGTFSIGLGTDPQIVIGKITSISASSVSVSFSRTGTNLNNSGTINYTLRFW